MNTAPPTLLIERDLPFPPKYSYKWAREVVDIALKKHARAADYFLEFTGLNEKQLAYLLAHGRTEWVYIRNMLKTVDRWLIQRGKAGIRSTRSEAIHALSSFINMQTGLVPENFKNYLDMRMRKFKS